MTEFTVYFTPQRSNAQFKKCTMELPADATELEGTPLANVLGLVAQGKRIAVCYRGSFSQREKDWHNGQIKTATRLVLERCHIMPATPGTTPLADVLAAAHQAPQQPGEEAPGNKLWVVPLCPDRTCHDDEGHGIAKYSDTGDLRQCPVCQRRKVAASDDAGQEQGQSIIGVSCQGERGSGG